MGFAYECNFNLKDCINTLGIEERGRVQSFVTESVLNLAGPYVPNDLAEKYENPHRLQDSGHIENGTEVVWKAPYARRWYYQDADFQGAPMRGRYWVPRMLQNGGLKQIEDDVREAVKK